MLGIIITVPIACFRKGMAREYLETYRIPPPSTCYGFCLSLVGETDRERHLGTKITPVLLNEPEQSVILRTTWRIKYTHKTIHQGTAEKDVTEPAVPTENKKQIPVHQGTAENKRPDFQQLLTDIQLIIWLDSSEEEKRNGPTLEDRVKIALDPKRRSEINRFGGLSLGESTHLVNDVSLYCPDSSEIPEGANNARILRSDPAGLHTWPVWVDHVGAEKTRYVTGTLVPGGLQPPEPADMPVIHH